MDLRIFGNRSTPMSCSITDDRFSFVDYFAYDSLHYYVCYCVIDALNSSPLNVSVVLEHVGDWRGSGVLSDDSERAVGAAVAGTGCTVCYPAVLDGFCARVSSCWAVSNEQLPSTEQRPDRGDREGRSWKPDEAESCDVAGTDRARRSCTRCAREPHRQRCDIRVRLWLAQSAALLLGGTIVQLQFWMCYCLCQVNQTRFWYGTSHQHYPYVGVVKARLSQNAETWYLMPGAGI